jgi:predicted DNA-binding transcriptional regulator AlpA
LCGFAGLLFYCKPLANWPAGPCAISEPPAIYFLSHYDAGWSGEVQVNKPTRKWLKKHEVRKILGISPGTIHTLRVNGTLPFTKIGNIIYYDEEDIKKMLESRKANKK